jgi:NNP family nitrate/nitrite transporter-like MFS transporter
MSTVTPRGATRNLVLATAGFMVNFWAWALIGPLLKLI